MVTTDTMKNNDTKNNDTEGIYLIFHGWHVKINKNLVSYSSSFIYLAGLPS